MKARFLHIIRSQPVFLVLLPVFFVLHGYRENHEVVPVTIVWILLGTYLIASLVLAGLAWIGYRNFIKACFFSFSLMAFHFFFGAAHDLIKKLFPGHFITRYSFILPFSLLLLLILVIYLKRKKNPFNRSIFFTNLLLLLFIIVDTGWLLSGIMYNKKTALPVTAENIQPCTACKHPDVYLIIADGYPGQTELSDIFHYNNQAFEQGLKQRGFHVTDSSRSNYNFTTYSIASMLDMDYLQEIEGRYGNKNDLAVCYNRIKKSRTLRYFGQMGYTTYNYSIFDFENQPSPATPTFLPRKSEPITAQTFLSRLEKEVGYHLATTFKIKAVIEYLKTHDLKNNNKLIRKTNKTAGEASTSPKFVYTHFIMPHHPYYFDSTGKAIPVEMLGDDQAMDPAAFISYLKHVNNELTGLVDQIKSASPTPPIIILMSDHGFREFREPVNNKYQFYTLNAIFTPDSNYTLFYKGMTNINQFRVLFNTQFGQHLPLLKDSTSFLID